MLFMDYHLHSDLSGSGHSESSIEDICRAASDRSIGRIAVTDHHDIGNTKFEIADPDEYSRELERCRALFPKLELARGIEMDYRPETWEAMKSIPFRLNLDFALLSLHFVDGVDPYLPEYFEERTQRQGYEHYLERVAQMIRDTEGPWVLGHITYVSKFARFRDPTLRRADYAGHLDEILRLAVEKGYGLEVNTSGIANGAGLLPGGEILRRYRELGGEIVTVGSDAHAAAHVGRWIEEAQEAVRNAGFRYLAAFQGLKPHFIKID